VAIGGILRARAGPQQPLRLRAPVRQGLPAPATEEFLVALVGELGVGNRDFACKGAQKTLLSWIRRGLQPCRNERIDRGVNPADEETGNAGYALQVTALGTKLFEPGKVRVRHPLIRFLGK